MSKCKRIFIVGHPGAGKGLLGKTLAEKLGWKFIDADFGLELKMGLTLPEILSKQGEQHFHKCESEILEACLNKENIVITTDAGILCSEKNQQLLSSEFVVNLKVSTAVQLERMSRNPTSLLQSTNLQEFLDKLHAERDSLYDQIANVSINSDDNALDDHVMTIIKMLKSQNEKIDSNNLKLDRKDKIVFHKKLHTPIQLSDQQAACLKLLAQGKSSKEIAKELNISYRTVEGYLARTMEIVGCSSSKELIALYYDQP